LSGYNALVLRGVADGLAAGGTQNLKLFCGFDLRPKIRAVVNQTLGAIEPPGYLFEGRSRSQWIKGEEEEYVSSLLCLDGHVFGIKRQQTEKRSSAKPRIPS
jgi:hypothetical protein